MRSKTTLIALHAAAVKGFAEARQRTIDAHRAYRAAQQDEERAAECLVEIKDELMARLDKTPATAQIGQPGSPFSGPGPLGYAPPLPQCPEPQGAGPCRT